MIDEYIDGLIDRWCETVPRVMKPRMILLANSALGWRVQLYFGTLVHNIVGLFSKVSTDEKMELAMREGSEQLDDSMAKLTRFVKGQMLLLARLEARGRAIRFGGALLLMMLSALGVVATRAPGMGVMAAALGVLWLSMAIECRYAPISGGIRQQYLTATLLRTGAVGLMMIHYFSSYAARGLPSNVVMQCALLIMLSVHIVLFAALVLLNTRQPLFLRVLAGVTGAVPAMTAAAAAALAAALLFRPWPQPLLGVLSALGALLAFLGEELTTIHNLGGIRLKYHSIWVCLLTVGGFALMLLGAWTVAP
ncbi:MAG: hypothetical protein U0J65_00585 [Christensenellales bacterium]|nr:hypothetical protein [Christensenellales bacterium]